MQEGSCDGCSFGLFRLLGRLEVQKYNARGRMPTRNLNEEKKQNYAQGGKTGEPLNAFRLVFYPIKLFGFLIPYTILGSYRVTSFPISLFSFFVVIFQSKGSNITLFLG